MSLDVCHGAVERECHRNCRREAIQSKQRLRRATFGFYQALGRKLKTRRDSEEIKSA